MNRDYGRKTEYLLPKGSPSLFPSRAFNPKTLTGIMLP